MTVCLNVKFLNKVMKDKQWKPADLARITNYSRSGISRLLKSERNPSTRFIHNLLKALPEYKYSDFFFLTCTSPKGDTRKNKTA